MIFVDQIFTANPLDFVERNPHARQAARHGTNWCHLWCSPDTPENREKLHGLAKAIGLRREWFQEREGFPHYDLVPGKRRQALEFGAVEKDLRQWIVETRGGRDAGNGINTEGAESTESTEIQGSLF